MALTGRVSTLCSAGDEGPAALAIVQASPGDCGMYRCTIHNEHGSASTDFCLSPEGEFAPGLCLASLLREGSSHLQRWCSPWADQAEDSCFLFFFSTQCCQDSSPEKKVKVRSPLGEWVAFIPALPSVGRPSPRTWNLFQMPCLPSQTATLCLLVQEMREEEEEDGGG